MTSDIVVKGIGSTEDKKVDNEPSFVTTPRKRADLFGFNSKVSSPFNPNGGANVELKSPSKRGIIRLDANSESSSKFSPVRTPNGRAGLISPKKRSLQELNRSARKRANRSTVYSRLMDDDDYDDSNGYLKKQDTLLAESILRQSKQEQQETLRAYGSDVELEEDVSEMTKVRPKRKATIRKAPVVDELISSEDDHDDDDDDDEIPESFEDEDEDEANLTGEESDKISDDEDAAANVSFTGSPKKRNTRLARVSTKTTKVPKASPRKSPKKAASDSPGKRRVGRPSKADDVIGKVKSIFHEDDENFFQENKSPRTSPTKAIPASVDGTARLNELLVKNFSEFSNPVITGVSDRTPTPAIEETSQEFVPLPIPKLDKNGKIIDQEFLKKYFQGVNIENNLRGRFLDEKAFFLEGSEGYFEQHSARPKPSSNSLTQLAPQVNQEDFATYIQKGNQISCEEKKKLYDLHKLLYHQWCFELSQGFNLNFYGIGSKLNFLNEFVSEYFIDWYETTFPHQRMPAIMVVNGFNPAIKFKSVLQDIMKSFMSYADEEKEYDEEVSEDEDVKPSVRKNKDKIRFPKHVSESVPFIMNYVESKRGSKEKTEFVVPQLVLLFHNIDGEAFRDEKIQNAFSQLTSLPELWLISSTDNINAPLLWDSFKMKNFNFLWHDLTTYESYMIELSFKDVQNMGKSKKFIGNKGAKYVLSSLTSNARNLYRILLERQLQIMKEASQGKSSRVGLKGSIKFGLEFKDFYNRCLEEFVTSNEITFRTVLGEFVEHKMSVLAKDESGVEMVFVPFNYDEMEKLVQDEFS